MSRASLLRDVRRHLFEHACYKSRYLPTARELTSHYGPPIVVDELDGKPTGEFTAVVMARIWRERPGSRWKVTAIGELGMGRAGSYKQIYEKISDCGERAEASKAMRVVS